MINSASSNSRHRLVIVGAGGFGREVARWAGAVAPTDRDWELGAFLDANPDALARYDVPWAIVGDPATYQPRPTDRFICAIGDRDARGAGMPGAVVAGSFWTRRRETHV